MFTKSLILVLLGSALILASPVDNNEEVGYKAASHRVNRSLLGFIADLLVKTDQAIDNIFDQVKQPFKKVYNIVIQTSGGVVDYGLEKAQKLLAKYYEIKSKSEETLSDIKNVALGKVIEQLQNVIDTLAKESNTEDLDKLKEKTENIAASSKETLEKLKQQLQEAIDAEKKKLEENLNKWKDEADSITNKKY